MTDKKTASAKSTDSAPVKKRTILTPEERVAKLEAELEAAKAKAQSKDRKRHTEIGERVAALDERIAKLVAQREELVVEGNAIEERVPELRTDVVLAEA